MAAGGGERREEGVIDGFGDEGGFVEEEEVGGEAAGGDLVGGDGDEPGAIGEEEGACIAAVSAAGDVEDFEK